MIAGNKGKSARSQLPLGPASGGTNHCTSSKSSCSPPLNASVRPTELLVHWSGSLMLYQGHESVCGDNRNAYNLYLFSMYDPLSVEAMGLIPVEVVPIELDIAGVYETQDRQRKNNRNKKDVPPDVISVCSRGPPCLKRPDKSISVDLPRIEPRNERFGTEKIS